VEDWIEVNRTTPRLVSALPNGPIDHPTVRVFLAGGVPEVMLHLRELGLLDTTALTASAIGLNEMLDQWKDSPRRRKLRDRLYDKDGVDPDTVIFDPSSAAKAGMAGTLVFPKGNLAPDGAVVKATTIDPSMLRNNVFDFRGQARVFYSESDAIAAIKAQGDKQVAAGDVVVLAGCGPSGTGMEETYQLTAALKHLPWGKQVPLLTDARFSGVSTGACIGHIGPEAQAGGPIGRILDGDWIEIHIDRSEVTGHVDLIGHGEIIADAAWGSRELQSRSQGVFQPHHELPDDTRLWAALQNAGGGTWGGCVYDVDEILKKLGQ
jgi:dihydroxyacid dehydratase/phosphogluconate dehydratase